MFQARSVLESTDNLFRTLAMLLFLVIGFYSAIEIGLYSLYRKKVVHTCTYIKNYFISDFE